MDSAALDEALEARARIERSRARIAALIADEGDRPVGRARRDTRSEAMPEDSSSREHSDPAELTPLAAAIEEVKAQLNAHPIAAAVRAGQPVLEAVAHERPWALVGAAAVGGAAVVIFRPWALLLGAAATRTALKRMAWAPLVVPLFHAMVDRTSARGFRRTKQ